MAEIRLTTGGIGTGKTYLNVKNAYEMLQKGKYKHIYSNIRAHAELCPGIEVLPDDWRECEQYSLIIIDECQAHEKFSKHFSSRRDSEIVDLTMIRHLHLDMWLISPNPTLVNKDVRDLVNHHIALEAVGKKTTKAYCFEKPQLNLSKQVKLRAFDEFTYTIEDKYCEMYMSTEDGAPSNRTYHTNMKLIGFIVGVCLTLCVIAALIMYLIKDTKNNVDSLTSSTDTTKQEKPLLSLDSVTNQNILTDEECRKGINVDKPECKAYFQNLTNNGLSVGASNTVQYDISKPFESEDNILDTVTYEVKDKPYLSGCADWNGKIVGYTQQGTIVRNISKSDCERILDGDRPFNYFKQPQQVQNNAQLSNTPSYTQPSEPDIQQAAKIEQAQVEGLI